ncbi:MAG: hypothetical protein Q7J27_14770 [Syntrophales bacterium]|nr:hypothetical protein [Syntrophales bacterium]
MLCKEGISKDVIEKYHEHKKSVNKFVIGAILQMDQTVDLVRRELRRITPGIKIERDEIQDIIKNEILKREIVDGKPAEEAKTSVKKASAKALRKVRTTKEETAQGV